jgi:general secretion pathway protein K
MNHGNACAARQRGVALITAILIAALVTVAAVALAARQQFDLRRSANLLEADQAYLYALAGETWARQILAQDATQSAVDTLTEDWARPLPPVPVTGGSVGGRIEDLQGRFNLNNLGQPSGEPVSDPVQALQRLLAAAGRAGQGLSPELAIRVADWVDADLNPLPGGAEDLEYLALDVPYRTGNHALASPSELAAVAGVTPEILRQLLPWVATLPAATPVNVNTAPAPVLMSLHPDLTAAIAEQLIAYREQSPFDDPADFVDTLKADFGIDLGAEAADTRVSVVSDYFLVTVEATIGRTPFRLYSLLRRQQQKVSTLSRSFGVL